MMRDVKPGAEDRQTCDSWLKIVKGLISPFGILFLIFLAYHIAGGTLNEPQVAAKRPTHQMQGGLEGR
jgi:hypothetical protein